uniref:Trifunctional enzyme subunit alpha, mitochondrial n=1 Tax=Caenorhabditis japonica TaxID=281687 RepID=A0A8R1DTY7_CAEJA
MLSRLFQSSSTPLRYNVRLFSKTSPAMLSTLSIEKNGDVGIVKIDLPKMKENVLNRALFSEIGTAIDQLGADDSVKSIVVMSGKQNSFVAGADIFMIKAQTSATVVQEMAKEGQEQFFRIEKTKKPIVAAIMGTCMGGGLELALACHYRIAVNDKKTQLAFPEVMLGLLPGAGGTYRLPRHVPVQTVFDMMLTGKKIKADKAKKLGIIDQVIQPLGDGLGPASENTHKYLESVAVNTARDLANGKLKINREKKFLDKLTHSVMTSAFVLDNVVLKMARDKVLKMTAGNYPAPLKIMDVVRTGYVDPSKVVDAEAKAFGELSQTFQSKALVGLFDGSTDAKRNKYGQGLPVKEIAVVGAGLMGAGIANVSIDKGIKSVLLDANQAGLERGQNQIATHLNGQLKRKKVSQLEKERIYNHLHPSIDFTAMKNADLVIEAVFEDLPLKQKIVKQIESIVGPNTIIASNTSALPIKDIAAASSRPDKVIGMHYFSPVEKMQLLEVIVHEGTSKETLATAAQLGLKQGKLVVVVKDCPGFFVVRCISPMMAEVVRLLLEGVSPSEIDKITTKFGFPVGAATLADEVGLDVSEHVAQFLAKALGPRVGGGSIEFLTELVNSGSKGRKSGKGIFVYDGKKGAKKVNDEASKLIQKYKLTANSACSSTEDRQIRIISRFINEAAICLQEGVIASPSDGDIASVFGVGFPPFWGGPFRFVDLYGADKLVRSMEKFAGAYEAVQFEPCQLLKDHAKSGKKFYN